MTERSDDVSKQIRKIRDHSDYYAGIGVDITAEIDTSMMIQFEIQRIWHLGDVIAVWGPASMSEPPNAYFIEAYPDDPDGNMRIFSDPEYYEVHLHELPIEQYDTTLDEPEEMEKYAKRIGEVTSITVEGVQDGR